MDYGFRGLARRDVKEYPADIINLTGRIAEYLPPGLNPGNLAVFFPDAVFPDVGFVGLEGLNKYLAGHIQVFREDQVAPFELPGIKLFLAVSGEFFNFSSKKSTLQS